jgi:hypothetical protein
LKRPDSPKFTLIDTGAIKKPGDKNTESPKF